MHQDCLAARPVVTLANIDHGPMRPRQQDPRVAPSRGNVRRRSVSNDFRKEGEENAPMRRLADNGRGGRVPLRSAHVFAGQHVGVIQVRERDWLVTFVGYDVEDFVNARSSPREIVA